MPAGTIANVPLDFFEPPITGAGERRRWRRRIAAGVVAVVAAAGIGGAAYEVVRHDCRGLARPDHNLSKVDGECIGWTDENAFAFAPNLDKVTADIGVENQHVANGFYGQNTNYVKVAVIMPMTSDGTSAMTAPTILHALEGAYVAQRRANASVFFDSPNPYIQLVLMNEGRTQSHWPEVTAALAGMTGGAHPVVAAVGLGVSVPDTRKLAVALNELRIPAIGGVLTAPTLATPGLFQAAPSNVDYIRALSAYLGTRPELRTAVLAYDSNVDYYVQTLRRAFEGPELKDYLGGREVGFNGSTLSTGTVVPAIFDDVKDDVCLTRAQMVFFAGRDRDLSRLIDQLAQRGQCGADRPLVILTGSTGLNLDDGIGATMTASDITLIDASASDAQGWSTSDGSVVGVPADFASFRAAFLASYPASDLTDGYAIGHHDAVAIAVKAVRQFARQAPDRTPTGPNVLTELANLHKFPGAGGSLSFDDHSDGWPHGKAVAIVQLPTAPTTPLPSFITP
jgi:hypothetical protein